jgi:hypothetical protein
LFFLDVGTPYTPSAGKRGILASNADVQYLLGAYQNQIFRHVGYVVESQVVSFLEEQRGRRARDTPARMPHASDDAVEVMGYEDGDLGVGFVHLDPQDIFARVRTTL